MSDQISPCPKCGVESSENYGDNRCWDCYSTDLLNAETRDRLNGIDHKSAPTTRRVELIRASMIDPEPLRWLWHQRLPLHGLSLLAGEAGLGKSTTTTWLAAQVSRGLLDGLLHGQPRDVLVATAEDRWESVVIGRLTAAGAELERVHQVRVADPTGDTLLTLPDDIGGIERACLELAAAGRPPALLIVDPIAAYISSGTDSHKDAAVRRVLAPLAALADRLALAALTVAHLNKGAASRLLDRVGGSVAFGAAPRSVLAFARDPDDADGEQGKRRVIVHVKSNHGAYAPTIAAEVEGVEVPVVGSVSQLMITGESLVGPEDLMATPRTAEDRSQADEAVDWLADELADLGWHVAREVKAAAKAAGHSDKALRTARERLHVEADREGFASRGGGQSRWRLPLVPSPEHARGHERSGHEHESPVSTGDSSVSDSRSCPCPKEGTSGPDPRSTPSQTEHDIAPLPGESYEEWEQRIEREFDTTITQSIEEER